MPGGLNLNYGSDKNCIGLRFNIEQGQVSTSLL